MTVAADRVGRCPNCGAEIQFKLGSSQVAVCEYCKSLVARSGLELELIGKVAELAPAQSGITLGAAGRIDNHDFTVSGRLQYEWKSGTWDEWYLGFSDGRWGWLAEAQGRFYLTFKVDASGLPAHPPAAGTRVTLLSKPFTVTDTKQASIIGAAGELPEKVAPNEPHASADLEGADERFATLDYGAAGSVPTLYIGKQIAFEALGLRGLATGSGLGSNVSHKTADNLACPHCGKPISLSAPDLSVRVVCGSCNSLIDLTQGKLRVLSVYNRAQKKPAIAIGSQGTLRGKSVLLIGWMRRSCKVLGETYDWQEYLLFEVATKAFTWLVESDGHWQLATPISAATVEVQTRGATANGKTFRHFSSVTGTVENVLGEFYWEVAQGDTSLLDDYILPPEGLSSEKTADEVNWTYLSHLESAELAAAFNAPRVLQLSASGVGEIQPWPHAETLRKLKPWMRGGVAILTCMFIYFGLKPTTVLVDKAFTHQELKEGAAAASDPDSNNSSSSNGSSNAPQPKVYSFISEPFTLEQHQALKIELSSDAYQTWTYAAGAVIAQETGESVEFALESSYFSGSDGEEESQTVHSVLRSPGSGAALLRADLQWDPARADPPTSRLRLTVSTVSGYQYLAGLLILLWPFFLSLNRSSFENPAVEQLQPGELLMIWGYRISVAAVLALFAWASSTGFRVEAAPHEKIPYSVRSSPGGYRSFHFWHTGFSGGK